MRRDGRRPHSRRLASGVLGVALCSGLLYAMLLPTTGALAATPRGQRFCGHVSGALWEEGLPNPGPNDTGHVYSVGAENVACTFARQWSVILSFSFRRCQLQRPCKSVTHAPGFHCIGFGDSSYDIDPGGECIGGTRKHPKGFSWALFHTQT